LLWPGALPGRSIQIYIPIKLEQNWFKWNCVNSLSKSGLKENAAKNGIEWIWKSHPANSPHRNEDAVSEIQTDLEIAANLANEYPGRLYPVEDTQCSIVRASVPKR